MLPFMRPLLYMFGALPNTCRCSMRPLSYYNFGSKLRLNRHRDEYCSCALNICQLNKHRTGYSVENIRWVYSVVQYPRVLIVLSTEQCPNPYSLRPRVTLGFNIFGSSGKLGFQMSKDSGTVDAISDCVSFHQKF
jgi:hypothetical protein